jgi:hypothetical protein
LEKLAFLKVALVFYPNPEIEIHDSALSPRSRALHKPIAESMGATQI